MVTETMTPIRIWKRREENVNFPPIRKTNSNGKITVIIIMMNGEEKKNTMNETRKNTKHREAQRGERHQCHAIMASATTKKH